MIFALLQDSALLSALTRDVREQITDVADEDQDPRNDEGRPVCCKGVTMATIQYVTFCSNAKLYLICRTSARQYVSSGTYTT